MVKELSGLYDICDDGIHDFVMTFKNQKGVDNDPIAMCSDPIRNQSTNLRAACRHGQECRNITNGTLGTTNFTDFKKR